MVKTPANSLLLLPKVRERESEKSAKIYEHLGMLNPMRYKKEGKSTGGGRRAAAMHG